VAQDWKKVVEDARAEIEELEIRNEAIVKRIAQLKRIILAGEPLSQPESAQVLSGLASEWESFGITDACREVLRTSGKFMSPLAVRAGLEAKGFDLTKQTNAMASIHTVLKRLKGKGEVVSRTGADGGTVYQWNLRHRLHGRKLGVRTLRLTAQQVDAMLADSTEKVETTDVPRVVKTG